MTQSELAARLGVTRQSVNRALVKLASRGLIVVEGGRPVRVLDRDVLTAFVDSGSR
jgi:DNA-binding FadR family transcriptional regulator